MADTRLNRRDFVMSDPVCFPLCYLDCGPNCGLPYCLNL
jgi:hypothetical protein